VRQVAEPDRVVEHAPAVCGGCRARLVAAPVVSCEARQVFNLPPIALQVVEHRLLHRRCGCGTVTMAGPGDGVPAGVGAPAQYGPGVRAVATYLVGAQHLPLARTAATLADLLGAPVSVGTVAAMVEQAAAGLGPFTEAVRGQLAGAPVVHFDETGLRVDGALAWVHSASTDTLTQVTVHPGRGIVAMQAAGVLPALDGVAVHDGWKTYRHYDRDPANGRGVLHGLCNAHHLRELTAVTEAATEGGASAAAGGADSQDWAGAMSRLLVEIHHTVRSGRDQGASALSDTLLATYQTRYDTIITAGHGQNPATAGRRNSKSANRLARASTLNAPTSCASPPTGPSPSTTTSPNATSAWSRSARRSADACGPPAEPKPSALCAATCPPPASKATTPSTSYASSPKASPGSPSQQPAKQSRARFCGSRGVKLPPATRHSGSGVRRAARPGRAPAVAAAEASGRRARGPRTPRTAGRQPSERAG